MEVFLVFLGFVATYFALSPYVLGIGIPLPWRRERGEIEMFSARECWMALTVTVLSLIAAWLPPLIVWTGVHS